MDDKLISLIDEIKTEIQEDTYTPEFKEELYQTLNQLVNGVKKIEDNNILTYLFRGWWISNYFENGIRSGVQFNQEGDNESNTEGINDS